MTAASGSVRMKADPKEPMAFDLHISIPDSSPTLEIVHRMAQAERITPDQAAARLLDEAAQQHGGEVPAGEIWGAFSSAEDAAVWGQAMRHARARRRGPRPPNLEVAARSSILGLLEGRPDIAAEIDAVVASRAERYAGPL